MSLLLHLSDPHFGTEVPQVAEALVALAHEEKPSLVIASGDITQRARSHQFDAAARFLRRLGSPTLVIPGNHDVPLFDLASRVLRPYAGYCRAFGDDLEPRHRLADAWVAALNTTRPWRHKHGEVSARQAEDAAGWLQQAPAGVLRVVVTHQPVAVVQARDEPNLLRGGRAASRRWASAGAHLVLGGHIHLPYFHSLQQCWPELGRPLWLAQAGTAVSSRTRHEAPQSVNLVRHLGEGPWWRLERWDFAAARGSFERCHSLQFSTG